MMSSKADMARAAAGVVGGVERDERVEVAVPGVADDRDQRVVGRGDLLDRGDEVGDARDGHADVLDEDPAEPLDARDGHPPATHQQLALVDVVGDRHVGGARRGARLGDRSTSARLTSLWPSSTAPTDSSKPIGLTSSTARTAARSMSSSADGLTRPMTSTTARPAATTSANVAATVAAGAGQRTQPQRGLGDDAERALRADEEALEVVAGDVLDRGAAEAHGAAVGEDGLEAEDVVAGDAVLHAAQAAGVGGQVAADGADLERRRVRRVPEAVLPGRRLHLGVEQTGLHRRGHRVRIDPDLAHPLGRQRDAPVHRRRSARQPRARHRGARPAPDGPTPSAASPARPSVDRARTTASGRPGSGPFDRSNRYESTTSGSTTTTSSPSAATSSSNT